MTAARRHPASLWATAVRQALALVGLSAALAAALWLVRDNRLPLRADAQVYELELPAPVVAVDEALALYAAGTHLFVDTREDAAGGAVRGAFRVRSSAFDADLAEVYDFIYPEDRLVLYDSGTMQTAAAVASRFLDRGYPNLQILQGGLAAWRAAGGALDEGGGDAR